MLQILLEATYDTLKILFLATIFTILLGGIIGLFLTAANNRYILNNKYIWLNKIFIAIINFLNNTPVFLVLIIALPMINNIFINYFSLEFSAVITLTLIYSFTFGNEIFKILHNIPQELSDTAQSLGAKQLQILTKFLLPEAAIDLILATNKLIINLFSLSVIMSALGVSGLGKLALEKSGYNDLESVELYYVLWTIILSFGLIYIIKLIGNYIIKIKYGSHS